MRGQLVIVGVGPHGLGQLTLESLEALKACRLVLAACRGAELEAFCRGLGVACEAVPWTGEAAGAGTLDTPALAARARVEVARPGTLGVVVDGNPALFSVADALRAVAPRARVLAAVSSFDQILVALRSAAGDLAARGVRVLNLEGLPAAAALSDASALTLLYNAGGLARRRPGALAAAAARLRGAGRLWLVECVPGGDAVLATTPSRLVADARRVGVNATLAVAPRVARRSRVC